MRKCTAVLLVLGLLVSLAVSCMPATVPATSLSTVPTTEPVVTAISTSATNTPKVRSAPTSAASPAAPTIARGDVPRITIDELKALIDGGSRLATLDVRPRESYQLGHIKGAVSFPWKPKLTIADVEMLPYGDTIVTYCECGPGEADSASVAQQLIELGAEGEIKVLADPSITGWIEAGYPTE